jgi:hypothetical protein
MIFTKHIFRPPSARPYQHAIFRRRFVFKGRPIIPASWIEILRNRRERYRRLLERDPFDIRVALMQVRVVHPAVELGADIGWLVSSMIKRAYGHNLRR